MAGTIGDLWVKSSELPTDLQDENSNSTTTGNPQVEDDAPLGITSSSSGEDFVCFGSELPSNEVNGFWVRAFVDEVETDKAYLVLLLESLEFLLQKVLRDCGYVL